MSNRHRRQSRKANRTGKKGGERASQPPAGRSAAGTQASPILASMPAPASPSHHVSLEPLAPVIVRSGRPFDHQNGVDPARFPPPSTIAGCLRTAWARATGTPFSEDLLEKEVAGPLLLRGEQILVPRPANAQYFGHGADARCARATPRRFAAGCGADLPDGLLPVQLDEAVRGKPGKGPAWWSLPDWLDFHGERPPTYVRLDEGGWTPPPGERRSHVAIGANGAALDGQLFQTEGLDLGASRATDGRMRSGLRLLARFAEPLGGGLAQLGGERRMAALQPESAERWPCPPAGWLDAIARAGGLSLTLVTPALFAGGYRPGWLDDAGVGQPPASPALRLRLRAAALERWQPHSGWDLARHRPRPTRKLIPAGAVYWFTLDGPADTSALHALWLGSLCDAAQDRRDGFGLALPAPWTPEPI